ncbi:hypothetical protein L228DRAFT_124503 [Xylona heveae TC161]|uniref:Uncharacterized protein n=1 Tax=Xylona heveae (strain CBS 132557 / TC161) TaxID=1328760 RepID=A0A165HPQ9_XYLHT|nr:hypothetical protein L228DRAFT_124503 [Xylona heveae TC161]KZF23809.1 hypothetical protein L228DRAFT_124503 [Xylona heveae TC161]
MLSSSTQYLDPFTPSSPPRPSRIKLSPPSLKPSLYLHRLHLYSMPRLSKQQPSGRNILEKLREGVHTANRKLKTDERTEFYGGRLWYGLRLWTGSVEFSYTRKFLFARAIAYYCLLARPRLHLIISVPRSMLCYCYLLLKHADAYWVRWLGWLARGSDSRRCDGLHYY